MIINREHVAYSIDGNLYHCAMDVTMHFVGGKWKTVVLWYLKNKTLRFSELKRQIPSITEKMLSIQLKALEEDGLIVKKVYGNKPPIKVEYSLSERGKTLTEILNAIAKWGRNYGEQHGKIVRVN